MASNESTTTMGDPIGGENSNQLLEANTTTNANSTAHTRNAAYRGVRFAATTGADETEEDEESWWSEVENQNLTLDQVPNVTSVFTPSPEDIIDKPHCQEETHAVVHDEDFDRLHRLADRIKSTINEQRERHLSESSDKSLTEWGKQPDIVADSQQPTLEATTLEATTLEVPKEQTLEEFKEELREKRLARQTAVQHFRDEIANLRQQLAREREITKRLRNGETIEDEPTLEVPKAAMISKPRDQNAPMPDEENTHIVCAQIKSASAASDEDDEDPQSRSRHANIELANAQLSLQMANSENISLRGELAVVQKHVGTLKEVVACCKQMLAVKEEQCNELKDRLSDIEKAFAEHEMKVMSDNLRQEYERQLLNIRQLRQLYEERQRVAAAEYENLQRLISIKRDELAQEQEKTKSLEERNANLVKEIDEANNELACLRDECKEHKFEKSSLKEEIGAVNTLFSQMVMGFNGKNNLDIDRLTTMLEENRTLLNDMATKECTDGATLPKLLFELVQQASIDSGKKSSPSSRTTPNRDAVPQDGPTMSAKSSENDKKDNGDDAETCASPSEQEQAAEDGGEEEEEEFNDDDEVDDDVAVAIEANDNENMAAVANDNIAQTNTEQLHALPHPTQTSAEQPHTIDVVDATCTATTTSSTTAIGAAVSAAASSVDSGTNEKVIVSTAGLSAKSKKSQHHHHRKTTNSKKSTISSSSCPTSTDVGTTLEFNDPEVIGKVTSAQEIIGNLPKVWRVLMELLSHHRIDPVQFEENGKSEDCYKSVETPNGPKAELSVSKTYLKLKDLILEKKSLVKETNRLKTLNCHLDYRLNEQEKRLSAVSLELTKTWHLVGKMQRQHRQLHTQEQILRYQLQQKRRLLHELKDELEYCRRKWQAARAKNDESQEQCNDLRREFARRKLEDANNSAESGYSDSGGQVSDEEATLAVNEGAAAGGSAALGIMDDDDLCAAASSMVAVAAAGGCASYRRKRLREQFEHTRKIKRMQSSSPGRANNEREDCAGTEEVMVLRWNSAPPTCGWRDVVGEVSDDTDESEDDSAGMPAQSSGAIPKASMRLSRRPKRRDVDVIDGPEINEEEQNSATEASESDTERAARILRLERQCKNLIQQVLETSDNRERLEVQLKRFQDEMSPVQYAVPLDEVINKKRIERMTRASSVPVTGSGSLTPREEEYTRKRSERLGRLEEESRQLIFRIKRTSDRGHYLRCSLDRLRRAPPSREGSFESNTEEVTRKTEDEPVTSQDFSAASNSPTKSASKEDSPSSSSSSTTKSPLTAEEEAYTARRSARLQRLEEESKQLLNTLNRNNNRGSSLGSRLDTLHERHGSQAADAVAGSSQESSTSTNSLGTGQLTTEQRIENIEKISTNRQERLRILEEEGRQLINRLSETSERGTKMINRIAERELSRQNRNTPQRETGEMSNDNKPSTSTIRNPLAEVASGEVAPEASALLPPLKNVACTSIVSEELTDRVTITLTPSQIAANQGAIPKTKPTTQLLASRPKSARIRPTECKTNENTFESLEDMVKRLQSLPFPNKEQAQEDEKQQENKEISTSKDTEEGEKHQENKDTKNGGTQQDPAGVEDMKQESAGVAEGAVEISANRGEPDIIQQDRNDSDDKHALPECDLAEQSPATGDDALKSGD